MSALREINKEGVRVLTAAMSKRCPAFGHLRGRSTPSSAIDIPINVSQLIVIEITKRKRTNDSEWQLHANATLYAPLTAATDDDPSEGGRSIRRISFERRAYRDCEATT